MQWREESLARMATLAPPHPLVTPWHPGRWEKERKGRD